MSNWRNFVSNRCRLSRQDRRRRLFNGAGDEKRIAEVGLPIPPLWIGALFVLNHAIFYLAGRYVVAAGLDAADGYPLDELKEHHGALLYAVTGVAAWLRARSLARAEALLPRRA